MGTPSNLTLTRPAGKVTLVGVATTLSSTVGFLLKGGHLTEFDVPGSTNTQPFGVGVAGSTLVNGVNNLGRLVGFSTDAAGNTNGFLATPARTVSRRRG